MSKKAPSSGDDNNNVIPLLTIENTQQRKFKSPPSSRIEAAIEALLFSADKPITAEEIQIWLNLADLRSVYQTLRALQNGYTLQQRGFELIQVNRGWQLRTRSEFSEWILSMKEAKPVRLSKAALETLAIVAYQQPITKSEIEALRGVDSGAVIRALVEQRVLISAGRRKEHGSPIVYATGPHFLHLFGLRDLADLPRLKDLRSLTGGSDEIFPDEGVQTSGNIPITNLQDPEDSVKETTNPENIPLLHHNVLPWEPRRSSNLIDAEEQNDKPEELHNALQKRNPFLLFNMAMQIGNRNDREASISEDSPESSEDDN